MEPKELYDNMVRDGLYTKSYDDFKARYGSEEGQRKLHSMMRADGLYTKDFDSFRTRYFSPAEAPVKKKVSGKDSAFDWETGSVDTSKLSSAPAPAQPAAGGSSPYELTVSSGYGQPYQEEVQRAQPELNAYESIKKRRSGNMTDDAIALNPSIMESAKKAGRTPLEAQTLQMEKDLYKEAGIKDNPFSPIGDRATQEEFRAMSTALTNENKEILLALDKLNIDLMVKGISLSDYEKNKVKANRLIESINGVVSDFDKNNFDAKLEELKKSIDSENDINKKNSLIDAYNKKLGEIKRLESAANDKISGLKSQLDDIGETMKAVESDPTFQEISQFETLYQKNIDRFKSEMASGRYKTVEDIQEYFKERQKEADRAQKEGSIASNIARSTGRIVLTSSAKALQSLASISDVAEKSLGLEGDKKGVGDFVQEYAMNVAQDVMAGFPSPSKFQRGVVTDVAKWGDIEVDFDENGGITGMWNKDGYPVTAMLSKQQEDEIKSLPRKKGKFHAAPFAYQAGGTIADVLVQMAGAKAIGGLKIAPTINASRFGAALGTTELGATAGLVASNAAMMSNDLYSEGKAAGLSDDDAARYALGTGVAIGLLNAKAGLGIEAKMMGKGINIPKPDFGKGVGGAIANKVRDFVIAGSGEALEEGVLENIITSASQVVMNEMAGANFDPSQNFARNKVLTESTLGFIAGGLVDIALGGEPNELQKSALMEGSKNVEQTMAAVQEVAAANGVEMTEAQQNSLRQKLEDTAEAMAKVPEEHSGKTEVVDALAEKTKIDKQIEEKKESIKGVDDSLAQDTKDEIAKLETESAKASLKVAEAAGVTPDPRAVRLLEQQRRTRSAEVENSIRDKELFRDGGTFSNLLGGSGVDSIPTNHRIVNGIEFVEYSNPNTGVVDVVMSGTSSSDYVGYYRIYENGKPTNKWSSKFENQSRNKSNFKTMISGVQEMLPRGHEYTEKTSISTDGLRVWNQQLSRGYELQYDENGKVVTNEVAINGDAIVNELGIDVNRGNFENIRVTTNQQFNNVKNALLPYLLNFGLNESNIRWEDGTVLIDLPVLRSQTDVAPVDNVGRAETINSDSAGISNDIYSKTTEPITDKTHLIASASTKTNLSEGRKKQVIEVDENGNQTVVEVDFTKEDADLELDRLEALAKKGKLTADEFQRSYFGQSLDSVTIQSARKNIKEDAVGFIGNLRSAFESPEGREAPVKPNTEPAPVKPDEKAVKKLEGDDSNLPRVGKMVVDPKTQEMYPEGKPDERKPLSGKTAKEYADLRIDDNAKVQDADTEGLSPEETKRKVLEEGSPKQVGQLWQSEPDIENPLDESNPNSRSILIRDAVAANKFSDDSIGRSKFSGKELDNVKKKFGGGKTNASELAEAMSDPESGDYLGIGEVTEEDIFDALEANMNEGVPSVKSKPNPAKKEAAKRFKKLTGIAPTNEYVDRLTQRSDKIAEESAIESHYDTVTGDTSSPPSNIGETVKRAVFERIMLDPTKSKEEKADIKSRGLTRESLSNKYVNEIADTTIDGAIQAMGFDAALEATVEASKDMKQKRLDAVYSGDAQALANTEVNEALASMLLQKVAHIYSVNGNVQKAGDVYEIADRLGLGAGQFIQSLSEQATPEAVANRLTSKALTEQKKVLRRMGAKGETIMDLIANLKEQVRVSREEARAIANESTTPSAKKSISEKKAAVQKKKSDAIASIKEKWANMQTLGVVFDPRIEAEKQAQLRESVVDLAKAYIEEGVVNVQELFNNIVETLKGIGIVNPDSVAKEAILSVHGEKKGVREQSKGTPQKLMDVPLRSTVSPEQINALEFKEQPKGAQVSSHGIDEGDITIGSFVANADMEVEGLVEKYANGELDRALWVELMDIGLSEKDAKAMERSVKNSVKNIRANKVRKAISQFKSKMDENGLVGNKKKWNESVDKLVDAFNGVNMTDDSILSALSGYFGYPDITSEDVKKIADIASAISASFSPELKARNSHELAIFMRRMKKKHSFWTTMAEEFNSLTVMGALNGVGTIANVIQGSVLTLAPKLAALAISSPIATRAALKAFKDANAKNIRMGWGALIDGFKNNVSAIETHGENHTDKYGGRASLVEDAILTGMKRYYEKAAKAKGEGKYGLAAKEATKFMWSTIMQPIRVAFLLKGIDGAFTHPIAEVVRYVETFNKLASEKGFGAIDFKNKLGDEFLGEVADYGKFRPEHWESARQQAAMEVGVMRAKGEEIPPGFELRRSKEIIYEQVKADEIKSALQFMKESLIMGDPTGALGTVYRAVQSKLSIREDTGPVKAWAKAIMNVVTGLFMRVSVNSANFVWNSSPGFLPQLSNAAVSYARTGHVFAKYVGEASAKEAPKSRQLEASGWVRLSDTEITQRVLLSAVSNAALSILFADMFDWDDEKKRLVLDPDRHFDVSLTLGGSFNPSDESADMKQMSIRFRWDKSQEFGSGSGYVMALPFMPAFSIIGGLRDDAIYRPDNMQFDSKPGMVGSVIRRGYWDILTGISQMSFNSIGQLITSETRAVAAAQKASAEGRDPLSEIGAAQAKILSRPLKTALQTNFYRDLYNEFGAMMDADVKKPANAAEEMMKDVWLLDMFIDGSRTDEYGNVLKRESKMAKIAESFTMNAVDFVQANEEIMSRPEWKLRKKFPGVTTSGAYRPSKDMKIDKKPVSEDDKQKIAQLFLDINGQTVRENYDYLNSLDADEYKDALSKIRNYAIEKAKDEVVPTKARPKLHLRRKKKGADN